LQLRLLKGRENPANAVAASLYAAIGWGIDYFVDPVSWLKSDFRNRRSAAPRPISLENCPSLGPNLELMIMHLGISIVFRPIFWNGRLLSGLFAILLCCAALAFPLGGLVQAQDSGMGPTPEITDFSCHLEGGWIVITGMVSTSGTIEISGITVLSFQVETGEEFREQVAYVAGMYGNIFAVLQSILGPISEMVDDAI
jgi:hypothetical protein